MKLELTIEQLTALRQTNVIQQNEVAYIVGDLLVIENLKTGTKRTQAHEVVGSILENNRRILKG
tara:strand:+ start:1708 stop:1899 length:192 start_codon:yes stop_codon:yes gene_type:complete